MVDFTHLHCHSEYSLLDGLSKISKLIGRAKELGMSSLALTDHGVMYGAIEFYTKAKANGINPILGMEAYCAPAAHTEKSIKGYFHTVLLAKNAIGYKNLMKLSTRAHLDGFYYKPRIDRELLEQHKEGLIVTQACVSGEVNKRIQQRDRAGAREAAAFYRDLMGPDHYYLELQLHPEVPELDEINQELVLIGRELGIPLVATNDAHFVDQQDADAHRMLRCIGWGTTVSDYCIKNPTLDDSYFMKSGEEMARLMRAYPGSAIENTTLIAERCDIDLEFGRVQLPDFPIPDGNTPSSYLRTICEEGLMRRTNGKPTDEYVKRLQYELDVIDQTGFPLYLLIVWDFVKFARTRSIPCVPRGSAGGSLVIYSLGISDVDPVANKLVFERFLNPERKEMPDIDMDFADSRRSEVIEYVVQKYGRDRTAQIITFGTLGAKAAVKDVGRVLGIPMYVTDVVSKLIPALPAHTTIDNALEKIPDLLAMYKKDPEIKNLLDKARLLEGTTKNIGTHACGIVVSREPLEEIVPLQRPSRDKNDDADPGQGSIMASYGMEHLGDIGLLKMDMLGLANLSIVDSALQYISETLGAPFSLSDIPLDDSATFDMLSRGDTRGVFQLEGGGMTRHLVDLGPNRVQDIYAMVALYRPGPMDQLPQYIECKKDPSKIKYLHPLLKDILEDTYGVITYQEQVLLILMRMAGYTMGQADIVRKAIGKKKKDLMAQEGPKFLEGCQKNGLTQKQAQTLWDLIQPFAGYSFNRAHATLYGLLAYQTAYLKRHYPVEYMAALLSSAAGDKEKVAGAVDECATLGVAVLSPDINESRSGFTITPFEAQPGSNLKDRAIRFGLSAIRNVGTGPIQTITDAREKGPFVSLQNFIERVGKEAANKRVLESLIKSGSMDLLPGSRHEKLDVFEQVITGVQKSNKAKSKGQSSLFDSMDDVSSATISMPKLPEKEEHQRERLAWEKEMIGMYISAHPVAEALRQAPRDALRRTTGAITQSLVGRTIRILGLLSKTKNVTTKKDGKSMLVGTIEDLDGQIEVVFFPRTYERYKEKLVADLVQVFEVKPDLRSGSIQLIGEAVYDLATAPVELDDSEGWGEDEGILAIEVAEFDSIMTEPDEPVSKTMTGGKMKHGRLSMLEEVQVKPSTDRGHMHVLKLILQEHVSGNQELMQQVRSVLVASPGQSRVFLYLHRQGSSVIMEARARILLTDQIVEKIESLLGQENTLILEGNEALQLLHASATGGM